MTVSLSTLDSGKLALKVPYHPDFRADAREIGGRWNPGRKCWTFDPRDESRVRELARKYWGTDGSPQDAGDLVSVRVRLADLAGHSGGTARFAGVLVAGRRSRDANVRFAPNVVLVEGGVPSYGGSMRYPAINPDDDAVVEIRDIPRASLAVADADSISYEIVEESAPQGNPAPEANGDEKVPGDLLLTPETLRTLDVCAEQVLDEALSLADREAAEQDGQIAAEALADVLAKLREFSEQQRDNIAAGLEGNQAEDRPTRVLRHQVMAYDELGAALDALVRRTVLRGRHIRIPAED